MVKEENNIIIKKLKHRLVNKDILFNKSTIMLLPLFESVRDFIDNNMSKLVNVYYNSEEDVDYHNDYKNRIYFVYKEVIDTVNDSFLTEHKLFLKKERIDCYITYSFKIPDVFINDFILFKKGRFSKLSDLYKKILVNYYKSEKEFITKILYPSDNDKHQLSLFLNTNEKINELYSVPDSTEETFNISNFYKLKF